MAQSSVPKHTDHDAAEAFRRLQLQDENGNIPADGLIVAEQQKKAMAVDPSVWLGANVPKPSGPQPKVAGLARTNWLWLGPGNIGGRLRSILVNPTDTNMLYVGSVCGGVWKTTNGAASWFPLDDFMGNLAIGCMVMDPANPNVIYAGTGEGFNNGDSLRGAGIFKTTDAGLTWNVLSNAAWATVGDVHRLAISPTNHLVILAATGTGIWRSPDGGANWSQAYSNEVADLAFNPATPGNCIASGFGPANLGPLALYSTDAGFSWTDATGIGGSNRVELACAPSSPNIVYASENNNGGEIYASADGGVTYALRNTGTNYLGNQGDYANCIWVDPTNPNTLIVGGLDLYLSTDGGNSLTQISQWQSSPASAHADHHAIVSAANYNGTSQTTVYFGNDGGIYSATNVLTVSLTSGWSFLNNNLGVTEFNSAAGNTNNFTLIAGAQDNGTVTYTTNGGPQAWAPMDGGDGGVCAADQTDTNYFYGEYVYLTIYRSTDGGVSDNNIYAGITDAVANGANFYAPFILDPNNQNTMLAGGSNLWQSVNVKAATPAWTIIKPGIASGALISAIAVAPGSSDIIWVGHNDGSIYATANGTAASPAWTQNNLGTPNLPGRYCSSLTIDSANSNIVYATFTGFSADNVYRTTDGGTTWSNLASGLPVAPVHTLAIAPFNHNYLYVGTEVGIFGSADYGVTWSPANEGPADVNVNQLVWLGNKLTAATGGRGVWQIALGATTVSTAPVSITAAVTSTNLHLAWPADHIGWRLLAQTNHLATGISANTNDWGTVSGSASTNLIVAPIDPTKPAEFYRLIYP